MYFGFGNDSWIADHSLIFRILYYRDILKCIQFIWDFWYFWPTSVLNWCASQTGQVAEYTSRSTLATCGRIRKISSLLERQLCLTFWHQTWPSWPISQAISLPGRCTAWLLKFELMCARHLKGDPGFSFAWFHFTRMLPNIFTRHRILRKQQCCLHFRILT
jgi:hypothetical protein